MLCMGNYKNKDNVIFAINNVKYAILVDVDIKREIYLV